MKILKELWTREVVDEVTRSEYQHMLDLQEKISETCRIAQEEMEKNKKKNEKYYNRTSRFRKLYIGDRVKVLLPLKKNKMIIKRIGPFEVIDNIGELDYRVKLDDGRLKTYHINMLKKDVQRERVAGSCVCTWCV